MGIIMNENKKTDYETILKLLQELIEAGKDTDRRLKETDRQMKDTDKRLKKTEQLVDKTNKSINSLKEMVGGMGNNQGEAIEEEFFKSLAQTMRIDNIQFHSIDRNTQRQCNGIQDEFDIIMTNTESVMITEVKYKFHPRDVKKVLKKMTNYKILYPQNQHLTVYGAIDGKILPAKSIEEAKKYNLFVFAHEGRNIKVLNSPDIICKK